MPGIRPDLPSPEPSAGAVAYEAEREKALALDPRKRANYERYLAANRRSASVDYLPIKLDIENVSRCNFRCTMCVVPTWPKGRRAADMPLAAFRRLIDEQYGLLEIKLQGVGEPLMQRDELFDMIGYARERHIWVRTTTNASLLHLRDNARRLIDSGVNEVQISIDGATKDTYEAIRVGSVFEHVLRNCHRINDYCRATGLRRTKMWTVVQKGNLAELEALVDLAAELGFADQVFSLEMSDWGLDAMRLRNDAASIGLEAEVERFLALVERGARQGVRVAFWQANQRYDAGNPATLCPWPFERAFVSSDSRVVPCCYIGNPDVSQIDRPLGEGHGFSEVWQGAAFTAFRQAHLDGRIPEICLRCYRDSTQVED